VQDVPVHVSPLESQELGGTQKRPRPNDDGCAERRAELARELVDVGGFERDPLHHRGSGGFSPSLSPGFRRRSVTTG
jgi:hypothetical protein